MALFTSVIERDPENRKLVIEVRDADGAPVPGYHRVTISLNDLETLAAADGLTDLEIKFRKHQFRNAGDACNTWAFIYLGSEPFADP